MFDHIVFKRKSCFFTGCAGAGKSFLLRAVIRGLIALLSSESVAVTSMTGIAAQNISGVTLHSLTSMSAVDQLECDQSVETYFEMLFKRSLFPQNR